MSSQISPHLAFPESNLAFHPERQSDVDSHPLRGLLRFGPYSSGFVPDPIRVATIAPSGEGRRLYQFMNELKKQHLPTERREYLQNWPGFRSAFNLEMRGAAAACHIEVSSEIDNEMQQSHNPHVVLADRLLRTIQRLEAHRDEFDVIFIYLPTRWSVGFTGGPGDDFDLHDHLKATTATRGIPIQLVREDSALAYPDRASVMWRVGLALYAKTGGVPWKLANSVPDTAYIGISYAVRRDDLDRPRFVTCCSQVFDAEGAGLEFVAYAAHEFEVHGDNPFLSRNEMFRVMTRSIDLYRRRHSGNAPRQITVHKSTEFKKDEVDGCMEAMHLCESVNLLQVVEDVRWRGVRIEGDRRGGAKGQPAAFPVDRGSLVSLAGREALLWLHGDVRGISKKASYFQGSRSTPQPLRLVRHAGHGTWDETAISALALSKMNWNNDALYDQLPVTMSYAKVLARVIKRMRGLGSTPYQFRFFM